MSHNLIPVRVFCYFGLDFGSGFSDRVRVRLRVSGKVPTPRCYGVTGSFFFFFFLRANVKSRPGHKIHNPKSEPNSNRKTRSVPGPKCKKYSNGSRKVVQNISEPELLLTEPERVTRKNQKNRKDIRRNRSECLN